MSYTLQFFSLPQGICEQVSPDPNVMPAFIEKHGRWVGEIEFAAGESHLFFEAVERLIKAPIFGLLFGSVCGVKPTKTSQEFGGLTRDVAQQVAGALKLAVSKTEVSEGADVATAIAMDLGLRPDVFQNKLSLLCSLLEDALLEGGEPATVYN